MRTFVALVWSLVALSICRSTHAAEVDKPKVVKEPPKQAAPKKAAPLDADKLKAIEQMKARAAAKDAAAKDSAKKPIAAQPNTRGSLGIRETVFDYKTVDGRALKAYVYTPAGDKIRPVLISLHPGALMVGEARMEQKDDGKPIQGKTKFFEAGFTIVSLEYRLAPTSSTAIAGSTKKGPSC